MRGVVTNTTTWLRILFASLTCTFLHADEPKKETASITAIEPVSLVTNSKATLKIRGFKLKDATEIRFPKATGIKAEIKEKKDAAQPNGLENKQVGESQILVEIALPPGFDPGPLEFVIATPAGEAAGRFITAMAKNVIEEKEPNNGFRSAQKLEPGKVVRGAFQQDKDVDVFEYTARAGQKLKVSVTGGSTLLMDAALTCYDKDGHPLASVDDTDGRNPSLTLTAVTGGSVFICVSDAHDKGGEWHSYLLTVEEPK
jgi:hypothetical protein